MVATSAPRSRAGTRGAAGRAERSRVVGDEELWYKDAVIYEVPVRAYRDANGDGIGDFRGLTEKLDYIRDLGVTAIWLLPFYPSPLRDDGYDIADFTAVHPDYGTLRDVRAFIREMNRIKAAILLPNARRAPRLGGTRPGRAGGTFGSARVRRTDGLRRLLRGPTSWSCGCTAPRR